MEKHEFIELLFKKADGLLTAEEEKQLEGWLAASPLHQQYEKKVREILDKSAKSSQEIDLDLDSEFERLGNRIKTKTRVARQRRLGVALQIAAGIAILILAQWLYSRSTTPAEYLVEVAPEGYDLPDGSKVWVTKGSTAVYHDGKKDRILKLTGLGFFQVAGVENRPFTVETAVGTVTVVGTSFEVDVRELDEMKVRVEQGIVSVQDLNNRDRVLLNAGDGTILQHQQFLPLEDELQPVAGWRLEPMIFTKKTLGEVISVIEQNYHVNFDYANSKVQDCVVTFTLDYPPFLVIVETLEALLDIEIIETSSRQYYVEGNGC